MEEQLLSEARISHHLFTPDGVFVNNPELPLLIYTNALSLKTRDRKPEKIIRLFEHYGWKNSWVNGIYDYHHYHSTSHEVLGIAEGECTIQLGGDDGIIETVREGDVIIIPAGVVHKKSWASDDFVCVGAYPNGKSFDINYCRDEEREKAVENISKLPVPDNDPVYGKEGPLISYWSKK